MNHLGTKTLETPRLRLRRFTLEDAPKMYENWASDPEVTKYMPWPTHTSLADTEGVLAKWVSEYERPDRYEWCMELKETGEPIGGIGAYLQNEKAASMEAGYCLGRKYWHKGFTTEAFREVIRFLLEEVEVKRIEARHDPRNVHSGDVMRKCGLRYEGTRIRAGWNNSGICDEALYGLVAEEQEKCFDKVQKETPAVTAELIRQLEALSELKLSPREKEQAGKDMGEMLAYVDKLQELDTSGTEPMSHVFPVHNVFREDCVSIWGGGAVLRSAPARRDNCVQVPKTLE